MRGRASVTARDRGRRPPRPGYAGSRSEAARRDRSWSTAFVWIWHTRLSVTPRTWPISARVKPSSKMASAIARDFGSVDRWRREFIALANALAVSSGWVLLTWVPRDGRLINQTVSDTSQGVAGGIPVLALDMYEHAYQIDFGTNAAAYVATFMRNIEWNAVQGRYEDATAVKPPRPRLARAELRDVGAARAPTAGGRGGRPRPRSRPRRGSARH